MSDRAMEVAARAMVQAEQWSSFWGTQDAKRLAQAAITAWLATNDEERVERVEVAIRAALEKPHERGDMARAALKVLQDG